MAPTPGTDFSRAFQASVTQLTAVDAAPICLTASRAGQSLRHDFAVPAGLVAVRSLAKVVTVLTLGAAAHTGAAALGRHPVDLDLTIGPLLRAIPRLPAFRDADRWDRVTLRHLLAGTTGHADGFLFRTDAADLITHRPEDLPGHLARRALTHEPGTHFAYSNAGYFLLSVLVCELGGRSLADWAGELLLGPMGVPADEWSWQRYGRYPAAATGLRIDPGHLHRVADLLLHRGHHHGQRLIAAEWIRQMTTPQVVPNWSAATPGDPLPRVGYGLGLWLSEPAGRCFGVGADGQYLVVDPLSDTTVTLTAAAADPAVQPDLRTTLAPLLAPPPESADTSPPTASDLPAEGPSTLG